MWCTMWGMIRTNIYLPEPMLLQLQAQSAATGISVAELVRRALEAFLARRA